MNGMSFLDAFHTLPAELQASVIIVVLAVSMSAADLTRLDDYAVAGTISKPLTAAKLTTILQLYFNARGLGPLPTPRS